MRSLRRQDGFTLVELLIVIVVLGILAAIVVFAVGSTRSDAIHSSCATGVRAIKGSAEAVRVKTNAYPAMTIDSSTSPNLLVAPQVGALLKDWPSDDDFLLEYDGTAGTSYSVNVFRKDGTAVAGCSAL